MTTIVEPTAPWLRDLNRVFTNENRVAPFVPPADVIVDEEAVTVYLDVPGLSGEQLDIELENDVLTVRGERPFPYAANDQAEVRRVERAFGRFERSLRVVRGLDPTAIEATLGRGVLTLRLAKPESLKPHRIEIAGGDEQPRQIEGSSGS
ncbi:MAG TPA: Hsp20/alpha crystallin family protein [Solirubrobacteraceae bacterium]|jgi:HSP20 family protein|nr:Hsp20/alpha crystallin family protein [Solirubrobacteraceae bacterium]